MDSRTVGTSEVAGPSKPKDASNAEVKNTSLATEFECSICFDLLLDPVVGNCGHDFCKHCYEQWLQASKRASCPICRKQLPRDLGVCVRLKNTIESLLPQRVRERKRQMEVTRAEECAKRPRTTALSELLGTSDFQLPFERTMPFERMGGLGVVEGQDLRTQPVDEVGPHLTLLLEQFPGNSLRQYPSRGVSGASVPAGLVPIQLTRPPTPLNRHAQLSVGLPGPPLSPANPTELQGIGLPAIPAVPAAATVLSFPAAITMPHWLNTLSASAPISLRSAVPSTLQQVITPALVLSPTTAPVAPPLGQLAPTQWGAPVEVFTMGLYDNEHSRRRILRPRLRVQDV